MKVPENSITQEEALMIKKLWENAAAQASLDSGIFVTVGLKYNHFPIFERIFFKVNEHEFENLTALNKALKNKAFL